MTKETEAGIRLIIGLIILSVVVTIMTMALVAFVAIMLKFGVFVYNAIG